MTDDLFDLRETNAALERKLEAVTMTRTVAASAYEALEATNAALIEALKAFLHLTKRSVDDAEGEDALSHLPDAHPFELTWGRDGSGYPQITVGQIKRAREILAKAGKL